LPIAPIQLEVDINEKRKATEAINNKSNLTLYDIFESLRKEEIFLNIKMEYYDHDNQKEILGFKLKYLLQLNNWSFI
jgi:hypothetical protein